MTWRTTVAPDAVLKSPSANRTNHHQGEAMSYVLLYQCGLANVIRTDRDNNQCIYQHAYSACEHFARGLQEAGATVTVKPCDRAGDALLFAREWQEGAGDLWSESKRPPL